MSTPTLQITLPMDAIRSYCHKWGIREFALFGSVLRDDFSKDSDIDVMLSFADDVRTSLFDLVYMVDELEQIFKRKVDLVTRPSVEQSENYIRRKEVLNTAQVIYAAS